MKSQTIEQPELVRPLLLKPKFTKFVDFFFSLRHLLRLLTTTSAPSSVMLLPLRFSSFMVLLSEKQSARALMP